MSLFCLQQPNRTGIARLDSYFDPNERKELDNEIPDLQITNKAKDIVIEQMQKE
jgi:hypothetical protein